MLRIKLQIRDSRIILTRTVPTAVIGAAIASLSTQPETILEWHAALRKCYRYFTLIPREVYGAGESLDDAPRVIIDLPARIVRSNSTKYFPNVAHSDGREIGVSARYRLSDDWLFLYSLVDDRGLRKRRIRERDLLDPRKTLYGEALLKFIVNRAELDLGEASDRHKSQNNFNLHEIVIDIHRRWLMTPHNGLEGRSPRKILLAKQESIHSEVESRKQHWRRYLEAPPGLSRDSNAYRFGGFGPHEWVLYYDLVRLLIWTACDWIVDATSGGIKDGGYCKLIAELTKCKANWLSQSNPDIGDLVPLEVIENERRRLPEVISDAGLRLEENDWCTKIERTEWYFLRLDGSHMEDEFVFSFYRTFEEWEDEQREIARWD